MRIGLSASRFPVSKPLLIMYLIASLSAYCFCGIRFCLRVWSRCITYKLTEHSIGQFFFAKLIFCNNIEFLPHHKILHVDKPKRIKNMKTTRSRKLLHDCPIRLERKIILPNCLGVIYLSQIEFPTSKLRRGKTFWPFNKILISQLNSICV